MRIWIDMTAPAHPVVFRPIIRLLEQAGYNVVVTARDYAQTIQLLERFGIPFRELGKHGGASRVRKLSSLVRRTTGMRRIGRTELGSVDLALAHGSNDLALAASILGIPAVNMFDYEWATVQHQIGCRLARRVIISDAIPSGRLGSLRRE